MFISRIFAVAVAALASVSLVSAAPTAEKDVLVKRATEDTILSTLNSLHTDLATPIGLINTAVANNDVSMATVGGPCNTIITLLIGANGHLTGLLPGSWDGHGPMPPTYNDCVNILVVIITVLIPCLGQLVIFITVVPQLVLLFLQIDLCLCTLLSSINLLLINVIVVVGGLVISVKVILQSLLFILTLGCLGL